MLVFFNIMLLLCLHTSLRNTNIFMLHFVFFNLIFKAMVSKCRCTSELPENALKHRLLDLPLQFQGSGVDSGNVYFHIQGDMMLSGITF